jgi:hypothetical protein
VNCRLLVNRSALEANVGFNRSQEEQRSRELTTLRNDIISRSEANRGIGDRFMSGFTGGAESGLGFLKTELPEMLGQVARFQLLWGLVGAAMHAVEAAFEGVLNAFRSGLDYLTQFEEKAAQLQGVIAGTVKYSNDLAENLRLTSQAGEAVARALEDIAIKTGASTQQLNSTFKALMESGVANFTKDMGEVVKLTEMFTVALQASGKDTQTTRTLLSEIQQLLDGSIGKHSKILEVLHLSQAEWEKIRESSLKNGDLVSELAPRLQPYLKVAEEAVMRHGKLADSLKLMSERAFALLAEPLWKSWTGYLEQARNWFLEHRNQIQAVLSTFGHLIGAVVEFLGSLVKIVFTSASTAQIWKAIGITIMAIVEAVNVILNTLTLVVNVLAQTIATLGNPASWANAKKSFGELWQYAKDQAAQYTEKAEQSVKRVGDAIFNTSNSDANKNEGDSIILNKLFESLNATPDNRKGDNSALVKAEALYAEQIRQIRDDAASHRKSIDEEEAKRNISVQEATRQRIQVYDNELQKVKELVLQYDNLLSKINAKQGAKDKFATRMDSDLQHSVEGDFSGTSAENAKAAKADEAVTQAHYRFLELAATEHAKAELAIFKQEASEGLHTRVETFDKEVDLQRQAHTERIAAYTQELLAAGANEIAITSALQKIALENQKYTDQSKENAERRDAIRRDEARSHEDSQARIRRITFESEQEDVRQARTHRQTVGQILDDNARLARSYLALVATDLRVAQAELAAAIAAGVHGQELDKLIEKVEKLKEAKKEAADQSENADNEDKAGTQASKTVFGGDVKNLNDAFKDFDSSVKSLHSAFNIFMNAVSAIKQGTQQGGTLGGIGAGLGVAGGLLSNLPGPAGVVGDVMSFAGGIFGAIGGLFTAAAKRIGEEIKKSFQATMQSYQNGASTLNDTIQKIEQERNDAIVRLSSKKGGKDQLAQLLPEFDNELAQLRNEQQSILDNFDKSLTVLKLHSDVLGSTLKSWQDINKQVKDYINAGGDAAKAAQFLSLNLQKLKEDAATNLREGEQQAIQDATQLNDLLQQRIQLVNDFQKKEFDLLNHDALEKRQSNAIGIGTQLNEARKQFQDQISALDSQISLTTQKVALEKQVYQIASDTAALQQRSNQLQIQALIEQINKLKDYAAVYNNIYQKPDGSFGLGQDFGVSIGAITINAPPNTDGKKLAKDFANGLDDEFARRGRQGVGRQNLL